MRSPHGPVLNAADHRDKAVAARASPKISTRKESGAVAPDSGDSGATELPPPASE